MQQPVSIREFRRNLAAHINAQTAVLIGDAWQHRAILVPLSRDGPYNVKQRRQAIARAAREMLRVLHELRHDLRR
jgi:hypothetical protein